MEQNLAFLKQNMNLTYESRTVSYVDIPETDIQDGVCVKLYRTFSSEFHYWEISQGLLI